MAKHVLVVGGGLSGLSAAYQLEQDGAQVTLIEREARFGGLLETRVVDGCVIEAGPDSFLAAKPAAMELITELGLAGEVIPSNDHVRRTFLWKGDRLIPMPDGLVMMAPSNMAALATTPLLSLTAKARAAQELLRQPPPAPLPDRSIGAFVRDHWGDEIVDYLAEPLLTGVFGGDVDRLSMQQVLPRFVDLETRYGSVTRGLMAEPRPPEAGSLFRSLKGGLETLAVALDGRIKARRVQATAQRVEKTSPGFRVHLTRPDGATGSLVGDAVVIGLRTWQAAPLLEPLDAALAALLGQIEYSSAVTVGLTWPLDGFPHPLDGFGFLVPQVERRHLVACTWVGTKFAHRAAPGKAVIRAFLGGDRWCQATGEEILAAVREDLAVIMGITAEPVGVSIARWPRSMPQYYIGHQQWLETLRQREAQHPGLVLTGNYLEGIGIPDCIRMGRSAAKRALSA
ncbi:MAG: protoporphyrinogen oxidase [Acidobacteria bacterium]|nr:protoporphyrinogen oxidase [Acidobacteriota bacterium]